MNRNENNKQGMTGMFSKYLNRLKIRTKTSKKDVVENEQTEHEMKERKQLKEKKENVNVALPGNYKAKKQVAPEEKKETIDDKLAASNLQEKKEEDVIGVPLAPPRKNKGSNKKAKKVKELSSEVPKQESIDLKQNKIQNQTLNETQAVLEENKDDSKDLKEATNSPHGCETRQVLNIDGIPTNKDIPKSKEEKAEQTKQLSSHTKNGNNNSDSFVSISNITTKTQSEQVITSNERKNKVSQPVGEVKSETIDKVHTDQTNTSKREKLQKPDKNENHAVSLKSSLSLKCETNQYQEKHTEFVQDRKVQSFRLNNQNCLEYNQIKSMTRTGGIDKSLDLISKNQEFNVDRDKQESYKSSAQFISNTAINNAESVQTKSNQSQQQTSEYTIKEPKSMNFVYDHFSDEKTKSNTATHPLEESHKQESAISYNTEEGNLIKECTESFREIQKEIEELENLVENFTGTKNDSDEYYYLDETLMKCLFKLDNVPSKNIQTIREKRREGIKHVQKLLKRLDQKTKENQKQATSEIPST